MEEKERWNNCKERRQKIISQASAWYFRRLGKELSAMDNGKSVLG